ncbi:MAG: conjugal transfer protein TrbF [Planctomycetota bacterium]
MSFDLKIFKSAATGTKTADTESPFVRAAQMADRRLGAIRTMAYILFAFVVVFGIIIVMLSVSLATSVREKQVDLYVVEVNSEGRPTKIEQVDGKWSPTEAMIQRTVADLVVNMRSKSSDPVVQGQKWKRAYDFLAGDAVVAMNQFGEIRQAEKIYCSVDVNSVVRLSDESLQVNWTEQIFDRGTLLESLPWTGVFRYQITKPATAEAAFVNPLGVFVHAISWSRDVRLAPSEK